MHIHMKGYKFFGFGKCCRNRMKNDEHKFVSFQMDVTIKNN